MNTERKMSYEAVASQYDRRYQDYDYSSLERCLLKFIPDTLTGKILEVGCGTGHWLEVLVKRGHQVVGLDPSPAMLNVAKQRLPPNTLVQGRAEALPWPDSSFDRVYAINAFHHFSDRERFMSEAYRVLSSGGGLLTVGLDPQTGLDQWSIYKYWPETLQIDKERYLPAAKIRQMMNRNGFAECRTSVSRHMRLTGSARKALEAGRFAKDVTSQLYVLTDDEYNRGLNRLHQDIEAAEAKGLVLKVSSDLRLYATTGWKA